MVVIEETSDGRWWISKNGWGRPVGKDISTAMQALAEYYPDEDYKIRGYND